MQTRIYWKKYVDGSVNSEGHLKYFFFNRRDSYSGLDLAIYVIYVAAQKLKKQNLVLKSENQLLVTHSRLFKN
jgi:hypothetical protein